MKDYDCTLGHDMAPLLIGGGGGGGGLVMREVSGCCLS